MMDPIPANRDIEWHKSHDLFKATFEFHEQKAREPESLTAARKMHDAIMKEILKDLKAKGISQRLEYTGSAYEGVKVAKCEDNDDLEFDVMMVLNVPRCCRLQSDSLHGKTGFSFIRYLESNQVPSCWFTENCLGIETDDFLDQEYQLVDASRTVNRFFGELQMWINESSKYKDQILLRRHGPAVQMDVYKEKVTSDPPYYSVDVVPSIEIPELLATRTCVRKSALEIPEQCATRLYVAKPLKNRGMPDSVTWRQLFDRETVLRKDYSDTKVSEYTQSHHRCMREFERLLTCNAVYQFALIGQETDAVNGDLEFKVLVVNKSHSSALKLDQVPEKPEFYWIVPKKTQPTTTRLSRSLKTCYRPCGMHLDSRRATTAFVEDLQECIKNSTLLNGKVHIRRDGPVVCLLICETLAAQVCEVQKSSKKPSSIPTPLYYVDLIFAHEINGDLYTARPKEEMNVRDAKAWRMSFSLEEKRKLYENDICLKKVFRILKVLRNAEVGLAQLTSYHLKTTLFWLKSNYCDWRDKYLGLRLMNVIGELERCLEHRNLPHFFLKDLNLTSGMINDCMKHMQNRLSRLYFNKRHMLKVLGVSWYNPGISQAVKVIDEYLTTTNYVKIQSMDRGNAIRSALDKLIDDWSATSSEAGHSSNIVCTIIASCEDDDVDFYAMFVINDHTNDFQTQETQCASFEARSNRCKLESRNAAAVNPILRRNMTGKYVDANKTASFVADLFMTRIVDTPGLSGLIRARPEGTVIKIGSLQHSGNCPELILIPGYKVDDKLFVAAEKGIGDPLSWSRSHFAEEQRKIRHTGCGVKVLHILKFLRDQESGLSALTTRHIRTALLWELHEEPDWTENKMAERLLDVMCRLRFAVTVNRLEDYFNTDVNVLGDVSPRSLQDVQRYLKNFCENEDEQLRILKSQAFIGVLPIRQLTDQWRI